MPPAFFAALLTATSLLAPCASGIVVRDDVPSSALAELAAQAPFTATGGLLINGNLDSSGILVAPGVVLGAAHSGAAAGPGGRSFVIDGQSFNVDAVQRLDPLSTDATDGRDAALFFLSAPVTTVAPAPVFGGISADLVGQEVFFTGVGTNGTSAAPPSATTVNPNGTLLVGSNVIDAAGLTALNDQGEIITFPDTIVFADFDDPNSTTTNVLGSAQATAFESQAALSDSGGGVFVFNTDTNQYELAALHSVVGPDANGLLGFGALTASTTFNAQDLATIQAAIPEPASAALALFAAPALLRRRR